MSRRLQYLPTGVSIASAVSALALPPPAYGLTPDSWNIGGKVIPEFELEVWSDSGAVSLTAAKLYGAALHPLSYAAIHPTLVAAIKASLDLATKTTHCNSVIEAVVAGLSGNGFTIAFVQSAGAPNVGTLTLVGSAYTFTFKNAVTTVGNFEDAVTASANLEVKTSGTRATALATTVDEFTATALAGGLDAEFTKATHALLTGDGPFLLTAATTEPAGLSATVPVWVIKDTANTYRLASSLTNAMSGVPILITDAGVGQLTMTAQDITTLARVHWHDHGLLGAENDGAVTLSTQNSYVARRNHSPRAFAYALVATIDTGSVSAAIYPVVDAE